MIKDKKMGDKKRKDDTGKNAEKGYERMIKDKER